MCSLTPKASWITITARTVSPSGAASYSSMSRSAVARMWVAVCTKGTVPCASANEVLDGDGLDLFIVRQLEAEQLGEERQLALQGPDDVGRLAEAVLLTLEGEVGDRDALGPQCVHDHLRLVRRHDGVLQALEHDERSVEAVQVVDGRAGRVEVAPLGIGAHEGV